MLRLKLFEGLHNLSPLSWWILWKCQNNLSSSLLFATHCHPAENYVMFSWRVAINDYK